MKYPMYAVNNNTGVVQEVPSAVQKAVANAVAFPEKEVYFQTKAEADAYSNTIPGHVTNGIPVLTPAVQQGFNDATAPLSDVSNDSTSVADFLGRLQEPNTWLRVAEAVIGGVFLFIAVKSMTGDSVTQSVKSGASKAIKVGAFF